MKFVPDPILRNTPWQSNYKYHFVAESKRDAGEQMSAVIRWCIEQFGPLDKGRWYAQGWRVDFLTQADATAFRLRWG
jgi:hypothetical protein